MEFKQPPIPFPEKQKKESAIEPDENIETQIISLPTSEKEFFDNVLFAIETGKNYTALLQEGKIDEEAYQLLHSQLKNTTAFQRGKQIQAEMGNERAVQIGKLAKRYLKEKETKKKTENKKVENSIEEKLAPQNIEAAMKSGEPIEVRVQRSSGQYESGWTVLNYNPKDGLAAVLKPAEGGRVTRKFVPLAELKQWQKEISPEDLSDKLKKVENFEDLEELLSESGGIQGSREFHDADQLISIIGKVRKEGLPSTAITRTGGLRQKVEDLLAIEKHRDTIRKF